MPIDMQHQQMGYDRTATMFSPEGHLLQVEYAEKTVRLGSSSIGMVCSDGVFIIADKRNEDLLIVSNSAQKVYEIDQHMIASVAGIISDARVLVDKAQVLAQQNRITYDSPVEPEIIIKEISNLKQQFTQYGGARPFGVSFMVAGIQDKKGRLYTSDITGNYYEYYANSIGEDDSGIKEILRDKYKKEITLKKGVDLTIEAMKKIKGDRFKIDRIELAYIKNDEEGIKRVEGKKILELK
ncbi:proteasome subunit alpha [Candidatus Pacearchaeota archaeon CG10_big_fil_rev_8_21_14_0_10_32_42]|nr:MAG: proteasome subunit alpha [Candidatus Pacearchaeota archaeon CG10_big_fil_rev_8_21_14_0_10_32_42]